MEGSTWQGKLPTPSQCLGPRRNVLAYPRLLSCVLQQAWLGLFCAHGPLQELLLVLFASPSPACICAKNIDVPVIELPFTCCWQVSAVLQAMPMCIIVRTQTSTH